MARNASTRFDVTSVDGDKGRSKLATATREERQRIAPAHAKNVGGVMRGRARQRELAACDQLTGLVADEESW